MCVHLLMPFSMQASNLKTVIAVSHFTQISVGKNKLETLRSMLSSTGNICVMPVTL